ncbi:hypothetical protein BU23DRAFT_548305 [Bimuria novae-zelandiae CBS 107.79]|uniref:Heterokaryon incompatibility domain-containing protein n=1 Tax=Bimuria novae-zelandiae CBS 107.79 TaxID=1447943 RepID=A0A6A5VU48_9PLEO|nr:hypothetical protein BU23DRAFT_548305 [Bimuria novae-zelandiae CBS 107.79]
MALQWFSECEANRDGKHAECNRGTGKYFPKRVLDITLALKEYKLRLVPVEQLTDHEPKDRRYATLSHCWGEWGIKGLPALQIKNVTERFEKGWDWDEVPDTFQQALFVTSRFKVKWLWIDSLCIVQDGEDIQTRRFQHRHRRRQRCTRWLVPRKKAD